MAPATLHDPVCNTFVDQSSQVEKLLNMSHSKHVFSKKQVANTSTQSQLQDRCWSSLQKENIKETFCKDWVTKELKNVIEDLEKETMENASLKSKYKK